MKSNTQLANLIQEMKKCASSENSKLWKRIATDLEKPTRQRKAINLGKINLLTNENEVVVVPGKVLGSGELDHKVTIAALNISGSAVEKLKKSNGTYFDLEQYVKNNPKGKNVRVLV